MTGVRDYRAWAERRTIHAPINRHSAKGIPTAIRMVGARSSDRQKRLLEVLPKFDSHVTLKKRQVFMKDLAALTAYTGDEFALFTRGKSRMVGRGNSKSVNIDTKMATQLAREGWKWSGHTHPDVSLTALTSSSGDRLILECFTQQTESIIYTDSGKRIRFHRKGDL